MALAGTHHIRRSVTDCILAVALSGELGVLAITDARALLVSIFNSLTTSAVPTKRVPLLTCLGLPRVSGLELDLCAAEVSQRLSHKDSVRKGSSRAPAPTGRQPVSARQRRFARTSLQLCAALPGLAVGVMGLAGYIPDSRLP